MTYRVFLSSTSDDRDLARDVRNRLEEIGVRVWQAEDIRGGEILSTAVGRAIKDADEMLALVTPAFLESPWTMSELGGAFSLGKRMTPIVVNVTREQLPPPLRSRQAIRFPDLPKYLADLQKRLSEAQADIVSG
jgi:hypothetical protein